MLSWIHVPMKRALKFVENLYEFVNYHFFFKRIAGVNGTYRVIGVRKRGSYYLMWRQLPASGQVTVRSSCRLQGSSVAIRNSNYCISEDLWGLLPHRHAVYKPKTRRKLRHFRFETTLPFLTSKYKLTVTATKRSISTISSFFKS